MQSPPQLPTASPLSPLIHPLSDGEVDETRVFLQQSNDIELTAQDRQVRPLSPIPGSRTLPAPGSSETRGTLFPP